MKIYSGFIYFTCWITLICHSYAQNVVNPYNNYNGDEMPNYTIGNYTYNADLQFTAAGYNGEYAIQFNLLPWFNNYGSGLFFKSNYLKTYQMDVIGFPFMMNCAYAPTGCADGSTDTRILEMPDLILHPLIGNQWGYNIWKTRILEIPINSGNEIGEYANIISNIFRSSNAISNTNPYYPHSSLRFTIRLHNGTLNTSPIIDQLVFEYDNTRGRMRYYPFVSSNSHIGNQGDWDVVLRPNLVYQNYGVGHAYSKLTNSDLFIDGKTLNYFPFISVPSVPEFSDLQSLYYDPITTSFQFIHPAPYILQTFLLYAGYSYSTLAGYDRSPNNQNLLFSKTGIKHTYTIQNNYNITEINNAQGLIYNPSEVDITAPDLHFPTGYTFKTIRGVYPTLSEVALSMGVEGNYHDLREVPVFTDLAGEDPMDITNNQPVRASKYYIKDNGKLTIEPCVTIYDATFLIEDGGTLVFQDRATTYGRFQVFKKAAGGAYTFTNQQNNVANYTLTDSEGQVTKPVSLVPQGNTYLYESNSIIESGAQQDPIDMISEISPNTHVVFAAEHSITLSNGFVASAHSPINQSVFHALIWPSHCSGTVNRLVASTSPQVNYQPQKQLYPTSPVLSPNPSLHNTQLHFSTLEQNKVSVKIYNASGQLVATPLQEALRDRGNHTIDIHTAALQPGIYLCTLFTEAPGGMPMQVSRKLVVQ